MELEDKLREAGRWQPQTEMPVGLERRALNRLDKPRRRLKLAPFATALAGAACAVFVLRPNGPVLVTLAPIPSVETARETTPSPTGPEVTRPNKTDVPKSAVPKEPSQIKGDTPNEPRPIPVQAVAYRRPSASNDASSKRRRNRASQANKPLMITADDPVLVENHIPVDAPVYAPAYYVSPSANGELDEVTPVNVRLGDPDVIYSEMEHPKQ